MSMVSIRAALEVRLAAMVPALATAWENDPYVPVNGTPYQRVYLLPAEPENEEFGRLKRDVGLMQITLAYPLSAGPAAAAARAELIRQQFYRGLSLSSGGVTVTIQRTPEIGPAFLEPDRYTVPVRIRWFSSLTT